ncbi:MAG: agmatinase [Candidatus Micrarchaeota archaeon]|nr:agmatinase [Candidatus Micrarchaeota archaeon]
MQPLNSLPKYNLFGVEEIEYKKARVVVLPIPYDSTVTYRSGTREGPRAIIEASRNMEWYSCELGKDISKVGVYTTDEMAPDLSSPRNMVSQIAKEVGIILKDKKIPLILGGEHTLTIGAAEALSGIGKKVSVIQFDAHSDTRDEMFNTKYMHATAMARTRELCKNLVSIGIRSMEGDKGGAKNHNTYLMSDVHEKGIERIAREVAKATTDEVYITIDLDVLDPSEMPSVGTPEPDGMRFKDLVRFMELLAKEKRLVGLDIVELCPIPGMSAPNYLAAKLAYLTIGHFLAGK